jgi:hypothetical protein
MKSPALAARSIRTLFPNLRMPRVFRVGTLVLIPWLFTSCGVRDDQSTTSAQTANDSTVATSTPLESSASSQILLFNGTGTSPNDVKAFEAILEDQHVNYCKR